MMALRNALLAIAVLAILAAPALAQADVYPPVAGDYGQDKSTILPGETVKLYAYFTDDVQLSKTWLQFLKDGTWTTAEMHDLSGTGSWAIFNYTAPAVSSNLSVSWTIYANDTSGRYIATAQKTFVVFFKPSCPSSCPGGINPGQCTDWSECDEGLHYKICYSCGEGTNFSCAQSTENRTCNVAPPPANETTGTTASQALAAINDAKGAVDAAKAAGKDTAEADSALSAAYDYYDENNFEAAKSSADEAASAASSAAELPGGFPWLWVIGVIIAAASATYLYFHYQKRMVKKVRTEPEEKAKRNVCGIDQEPLTYGYKCDECGKTVCFKHARTFKDKIYCTECLKKKGLM